MTNKDISRTLLTIWPDLPRYHKILKEKTHNKVIESYNNPNATMRIIDKIIDLTVQKDTINNLSADLQRAIANLPPQQQTMLRNFYYNKKKTATDMATEMEISVRSFYRALDSATIQFAKQLESVGINQFTFANLTKTVPWIRTVAAEICKQ
jgi:DNA-directed RNA polymerase specialized sigma subunit